MRHELLSRDLVRRHVIGRPRRALWVGGTDGSDGADVARERGARVIRMRAEDTALEATEPVDLVFVSEPAGRAQLDVVLARTASGLEDGGHVIVERSGGLTIPAVVEALADKGLTVLFQHGSPMATPTFVVARRPPARRPLSLTVGMIAMNEERAVGRVIDGIRRHRPDAEILVVDSSRDATPDIAAARGARVIRQVPPRGYGPAMTRLLYEATTDVTITVDCDGTYPADRIDDLHRRIEAGADLVNASRTRRWSKTMPLANYAANRIFAAVSSAIHDVATSDVHSGMRAYRTSMLRALYVEPTGLALPVELLLVPARRGYLIEEVDIPYDHRIGTSTLDRWDSTVATFRRIARAAFLGGQSLRHPDGTPGDTSDP